MYHKLLAVKNWWENLYLGAYESGVMAGSNIIGARITAILGAKNCDT